METIRLDNISKVYGKKNEKVKVNALSHINLSLFRGKIYAIMGPSGSGKSTLMHIIGLLDRSTSGKYYLNGEDISSLDDNRIAHYRNREIGFVFQAFNLLPRYSVYKNVELPMVYKQAGAKEKKERINELLDSVGLSKRYHHKPNELSGGEKQRVAIARALVNNPSIVMADEPTGNLDSKTEKEIMALFANLRSEERTIILVTHDESVAGYADEIIRIRDGEVEE